VSDNQEIAERLRHFGANIETWQAEAARLKQLVVASREEPVDEAQLTALEETAGAIYRDISAFNDAVAEVAAKRPEAAAELAPVSDAIRLVLLEITELGVRLYSEHSGLVHSGFEPEGPVIEMEVAGEAQAVDGEDEVPDAVVAESGEAVDGSEASAEERAVVFRLKRRYVAPR
jgi:hypothetical protein